jgi:CHAT domain-containing protein
VAHSFADRPTLQCPECGRAFAPDVWLIIDAAERPDLLARVRDGSIHHVVCPNGHGAAVDAGLLVYRPGTARPLLFSPGERATTEQSERVANDLINRLADSLGDVWRDEWLESAALVPRPRLAEALDGLGQADAVPPGVQAALAEVAAALAAEGVVLKSPADLERALDERPALRQKLAAAVREAAANAEPAADRLTDPLTATLRAYVETPDWIASYRFLVAQPALLTDAADERLAWLVDTATSAGRQPAADAFAEHRQLLRRARAVGAARAYAEKLGVTPEQVASMAAAEPLSPPARQAIEEVVAALRAEGIAVDSPEALQAALAARPELAARLAGAMQAADAVPPAADVAAPAADPLRASLQAFVQAETWLASYRYVMAHPELLTEAADAALAQAVDAATAAADERAARFYSEHLALLRRARAVGAAQAFAEKLNTTVAQLAAAALGESGPDVPPQYRADLAQANEAEARYRATGNTAALDESAAAWGRVLDDAGFAAAPEPFQLGAFNAAAIVFIRRYRASGRLTDLDRALALWQDAVRRTPADAPDRAGYLNNLGTGLRDRYTRTGRGEDLDAAIAAFDDAVRRAPADAPDRAGHFTNLGLGLRDRYARTGRGEDLDAAIAAFDDAVRRAPADAPDRAGHLTNLGLGLRDRYARTGRGEDLDAAIAAFEDAVRRTPSDAPDRAGHLTSLGLGLRDRYARTGRGEDLDAAIAAFEDAVRRTPSDAPDRAGHLTNLGLGLRDRYARTGRGEDLDAAIAAFDDAVRRTPADAPERAGSLTNLGAGLHDRYARTGRGEDLDAAIAAFDDAVRRSPADAPERAGRLNNLGAGLHDRYARTGRGEDLDAAIAAFDDAVRRSPADALARASTLNNLGNGLSDRYARTGRGEDLDAAIAAFEDAVRRAPADAPARASTLNNLGNGLHDRYARTGRGEDLDAAIAAFDDAVRRTPADAPERAGRLNNLGIGLHDRHARTGRGEDLDAAIAAFDDAVRRTPADAPARAMYLNNLGTGLHDRYARTGRGEDLDAAIARCRAACLAAEATAGEVALWAARAWAYVALRRGHWAEAQDAAARGRATLQRLNEVNVLAGERASWLKEVQGLAAAEAYAHARLGDARAAVLALETGQAQTLNAALGRGRDRALLADLRGDDPPLFAAYQAAADAVRAAQRLGAGGATPAGDGPGLQPTVDEVRRRVVATQAALDAVIARVRARPGYADLFAPVAFDDVAAAVGATPLAYLATTPGGSVVLLLHRRGDAVTVDALWADLTAAELDWLLLRRAVAAGNVGPVAGGLLPAQVTGFGLGPELAAALPVLGARLLAPLAARLRALGATAVTLIPGGRLNLLPLHAATYYKEDDPPRTFLDEFAVTFAPSAEVAGRAQGSRGAGEQGSGWQPLRAVEEGAPPRPPAEGWGEGSSALVIGNPLPLPPGVASLRFAREEAATVAGLYREQAAFAGRVAFLPETAATHDAVSAALPDRAVLHFACHGAFDAAAPLDSGLLLAHGEMLTLRQVRDTAALAGARLVVLSACQTGLTDFRELPDEVIGLPAGFLEAGAAGVVGSLWPVDDRSTALLMGDFHRRVLAGEGAAEALRAAQRWLRGATRAELGAYYEAHIRQMSAAEAFAAQGQMVGGGPPDEAPYAAPTHWAAFTFNGA